MEHISATDFIRDNGLCKGIGRISGIYAITVEGRVVYIGQSTNLLSRVTRHIRNALNSHKRQKYQILKSVILAKKSVNCVSIEECDKKDLNNREQYFIDKYSPPLNSTKQNDVKNLSFETLVQNLCSCKVIE